MIKALIAALTLIMFSAVGYAQEGFTPDELKAVNEYEAGVYDQALNFYQNLLNAKLNSSQLSIVHYNIGTIYLAKYDYANALKNFQQALQGAGASNPLLIRNTELNLALTRTLQAMQFMDQKDNDPDLIQDWVRSAEYDLQDAQNAACEEDVREGYPECRPNPAAQKIYEALKDIKSKLPANINYQRMLPSLAFLQSALYAWASKQPALADVFLQLALEDAKNKDGMDLITQSASPQDMLKQLIYHQRELQQIGMQIRSRSTLPESFLAAMAAVQEQFNQAARGFYPLVYKTQDTLFHATWDPEEKNDSRCQQVPWDIVLPEYQTGLNDADKAYNALVSNSLQVAITHEETAAAAWEQALAYLINPPKQAPQFQQAQGQQSPKGQQPKKDQSQPPQPSESMQHLLMNLQEMDMDTHPNSQTRGIKLKEVDKPW